MYEENFDIYDLMIELKEKSTKAYGRNQVTYLINKMNLKALGCNYYSTKDFSDFVL